MSTIEVRTTGAAPGAYCPVCGYRITVIVFGPAPEGSGLPAYSIALSWSWHRDPGTRVWTHGRRHHAAGPEAGALRRQPSQPVQDIDRVKCPGRGCGRLLSPPG